MILGHDYLPSPGIPITGLPLHPLTSLAPKSLNELVHKHNLTTSPSQDSQMAAERHVHALGMALKAGHCTHAPGWIHDKHERSQAM